MYATHWLLFKVMWEVFQFQMYIRGKRSNFSINITEILLKVALNTNSELLLFNTKWTIFQPYHDRNKLYLDEMMMMMSVLDQHA
jgi:hypothetical protein